MKRLKAVPNPVDLEKARVGGQSNPKTSKVSVTEGATFIEPGIIDYITEEFEAIRKAGVQHLHAGYSFEEGVLYYITEAGTLTIDADEGIGLAGVGTSYNSLHIVDPSSAGDFIDEFNQVFVDEEGVGFDDPEIES